MTLDGQFIFDILLVRAGGAISLFISMLRDEMKDMKQHHAALELKVQRHEVDIPKEYIRKEDMNRVMDELTTRLANIEMDIKQLLKNIGHPQH